MEFEWDPAKASSNLRKHGVSFSEAAASLLDPAAVTVFDPDYSVAEDRFVTIGLTAADRLIVVGYTERESKIRIIFARRATARERLDYEEI